MSNKKHFYELEYGTDFYVKDKLVESQKKISQSDFLKVNGNTYRQADGLARNRILKVNKKHNNLLREIYPIQLITINANIFDIKKGKTEDCKFVKRLNKTINYIKHHLKVSRYIYLYNQYGFAVKLNFRNNFHNKEIIIPKHTVIKFDCCYNGFNSLNLLSIENAGDVKLEGSKNFGCVYSVPKNSILKNTAGKYTYYVNEHGNLSVHNYKITKHDKIHFQHVFNYAIMMSLYRSFKYDSTFDAEIKYYNPNEIPKLNIVSLIKILKRYGYLVYYVKYTGTDYKYYNFDIIEGATIDELRTYGDLTFDVYMKETALNKTINYFQNKKHIHDIISDTHFRITLTPSYFHVTPNYYTFDNIIKVFTPYGKNLRITCFLNFIKSFLDAKQSIIQIYYNDVIDKQTLQQLSNYIIFYSIVA